MLGCKFVVRMGGPLDSSLLGGWKVLFVGKFGVLSFGKVGKALEFVFSRKAVGS